MGQAKGNRNRNAVRYLTGRTLEGGACDGLKRKNDRKKRCTVTWVLARTPDYIVMQDRSICLNAQATAPAGMLRADGSGYDAVR
jgi:hypothetical protein